MLLADLCRCDGRRLCVAPWGSLAPPDLQIVDQTVKLRLMAHVVRSFYLPLHLICTGVVLTRNLALQMEPQSSILQPLIENIFNQSKATAASCPLNAPEEAREGKQEVTKGIAAAKEICSCCSSCSLSELDGILSLKE